MAVVYRQQFLVLASIQIMSCYIEALFNLQKERNTWASGNNSMNC